MNSIKISAQRNSAKWFARLEIFEYMVNSFFWKSLIISSQVCSTSLSNQASFVMDLLGGNADGQYHSDFDPNRTRAQATEFQNEVNNRLHHSIQQLCFICIITPQKVTRIVRLLWSYMICPFCDNSRMVKHLLYCSTNCMLAFVKIYFTHNEKCSND